MKKLSEVAPVATLISFSVMFCRGIHCQTPSFNGTTWGFENTNSGVYDGEEADTDYVNMPGSLIYVITGSSQNNGPLKLALQGILPLLILLHPEGQLAEKLSK